MYNQLTVGIIFLLTLVTSALAADWEMKQAPLMTRWADDVNPENPWPEYPRPQLVREQWQNLNGLWDYAIQPKAAVQPTEASPPDSYDGKILVPYPIESALSGVMQTVTPDQRLWYRRTFEAPDANDGRVLLHFGAVDWDATVWVNGKGVGRHRGGYNPFTLDITDALTSQGPQELLVAVEDPTDKGTQPRGKQILNPHGIWYTPTTGIWQTVWLEPVPKHHIRDLQMAPDLKAERMAITVLTDQIETQIEVDGGGQTLRVRLEAFDGRRSVGKAEGPAGRPVHLPIAEPRLWSPDEPFLYDLKITLLENGRPLDQVESYFGMREISVADDEAGIPRLMLNGEVLFQYGLLDQGFWPDGLYTAPTDEALRYDIEVTRQLGFNMARKHVKVEPARWYYWCDKLGLLVWQDMPSGDGYIGPNDPDFERTPESVRQFKTELRQIVAFLDGHPSIVMWVPFNEGWGQFDTAGIVDFMKALDPTRLINSASGWTDRGVGDVHDVHRYPGPGMPAIEERRAAVLGEFGGLGLPLKGHTWQDERNWGYRNLTSREQLTEEYIKLMQQLHPLIAKGLAAAVYTQTTDVEIEVNGLLSYDRAVIKPDQEKIKNAHEKLYGPPPKIEAVVPSSREQGQTWRYTTEQPPEDWMRPDFDDRQWTNGQGGFGREETPGAVVRTEWTGEDIWLRRTFEMKKGDMDNLYLYIHHDEDVVVYINGQKVAEPKGFTTDYQFLLPDRDPAEILKPGRNVMAVHCHQTGGGQYIDVGLIRLDFPNR